MRTADFDYALPPELIAQSPASVRDRSRLLVLHRPDGLVEHRNFSDIAEYCRAGDVLVLNDSRVIPARLRGKNGQTGGAFEILLLEENEPNDWWALLRPGKRARLNAKIDLLDPKGAATGIRATVIETNAEGHRRLQFSGVRDLGDALDHLGEVPLPPYIERPRSGPFLEDAERYQTVYAREAGSVAAPTAGLHFTQGLLNRLRRRGVEVCWLTLHVGLGTFAPVKAEHVADHIMHEERFTVGEETAAVVNQAKREGRRVIAVGTTSVRVLESVAAGASVRARRGRTRIFL
jgi:S-adenosylmethionine:tRNA ribosyltransferase-isomerase